MCTILADRTATGRRADDSEVIFVINETHSQPNVFKVLHSVEGVIGP